MKTYEILDVAGKAAIHCLVCGKVSYNLNDVLNLYCGYCHTFHKPETEDHWEREFNRQFEEWQGNSDGTVGVE